MDISTGTLVLLHRVTCVVDPPGAVALNGSPEPTCSSASWGVEPVAECSCGVRAPSAVRQHTSHRS